MVTEAVRRWWERTFVEIAGDLLEAGGGRLGPVKAAAGPIEVGLPPAKIDGDFGVSEAGGGHVEGQWEAEWW